MYFKGCENAKTYSSKEENNAYREGYNRIFGKKEVTFSGKQTYDDASGRWVDSQEYTRIHQTKRKEFLIGGKRETKITLFKPNGKVKDGTFTGYKREPILKMEYH